MKNLLLSFVLIIFLSCTENDSGFKYAQFTSDDLSYLYYNSDTLTFTGDTIYFKDTITFMLNGSKIIRVPVATKIVKFFDPLWYNSNEAGIDGQSTLNLNKETGFFYADVDVSRQHTFDEVSEKFFYIKANGGFSFAKRFFTKDEMPLDTALVLGVHYENVLKFYPDSLSQTNIKSIYFAKKFGFIKIETLDGKTMERVLPV
ncbi:MAG TPA: hypothetical protein VFP20_00360 [Bacteroidales bacterium]|nr:hypothetical protein [Bacteroidales bacterium]